MRCSFKVGVHKVGFNCVRNCLLSMKDGWSLHRHKSCSKGINCIQWGSRGPIRKLLNSVIMWKTTFATQSLLSGFLYKSLKIFEIFKLSLNLLLINYRTQIFCYEQKKIWSPMRPKQRFFDSLCISIFTRICMENHSTVTGRQELFFECKILLSFQ